MSTSFARPEPRRAVLLLVYASVRDGTVKLGGFEKRMCQILSRLQARDPRYAILVKVSDCGAIKATEEAYRGRVGRAGVDIYVTASWSDSIRRIMQYRPLWCVISDPHRGNAGMALISLIVGSRLLLMNVTTNIAHLKFGGTIQEVLFKFFGRAAHRVDTIYPSGYLTLASMLGSDKVTLCPPFYQPAGYRRTQKRAGSIVFLGGLEPVKNPLLLIEAVALVANEARELGVRVTIAGSGSLRKACEQRIQARRVEDLIFMPGQTCPSDILPEADIFVSLQSYDNYPSQALLEAYEAGCRALVSDEGDSALMVSPEFARLVPLRVADVASALVDLLRKPQDEVVAARAAAHCFAVEHFAEDPALEHLAKTLA